MHGQSVFLIGVVTIVIAVAALAFIFWSVTNYAEACQTEQLDVCNDLTGPSFPILLIVLIIAGLILVSSTVVYIMVTA